jgi:hypothetical protein
MSWRTVPYTELGLSGRANKAIEALAKKANLRQPVTVGFLHNASEYMLSRYKGFGMLTRREIKLVVEEFIRNYGDKEVVNEVPAELASVEKAWGAQAEKADRKAAEREEEAAAVRELEQVTEDKAEESQEPQGEVRYTECSERVWHWFNTNHALVEDLVAGRAAIFYPTQEQLADAIKERLLEVTDVRVDGRPITNLDPVFAWAPSPESEVKADPLVRWMTVREAATSLGLSVAGIRKRVKEGRMPTRKEGPGKFDRIMVGVPV